MKNTFSMFIFRISSAKVAMSNLIYSKERSNEKEYKMFVLLISM